MQLVHRTHKKYETRHFAAGEWQDMQEDAPAQMDPQSKLR